MHFRPLGPRQVIAAWREAMQRVGLVLTTGHGIPDATFDALHASARQFFALGPQVRSNLADWHQCRERRRVSDE